MSSLRALLQRGLQSRSFPIQRRYQSNGTPSSPTPPSQPQHDSPTKAPNPHRNFYKEFGRPLLKNFLIAVATYQILYWGWMKLENMEMKQTKTGELRALEGEIRGLSRQESEK